jgi:4'-phosphopantetheinyl transferase
MRGDTLDDVHIWTVMLRCEPELVSRARSYLAEDERLRADRFRVPEARETFILGRATLRVLLSDLGCGAPADLRFTYGSHGKPALAAECGSAIHFNVSHSGGLLACAFARRHPVGVDVEQCRPIDFEPIAHRFFSPAEHDALMNVDESARLAGFYTGWVRKEAFIKALSGGLSIPLDSFRVSLDAGSGAALLDVGGNAEEARKWTLQSFAPAIGFFGAVAIPAPEQRVHLRAADVRELLATAGRLAVKSSRISSS